MRLLEAASNSLISSKKPVESHIAAPAEKYLELSNSPGYAKTFDGPNDTLNEAARFSMMTKKGPGRKDAKFFDAAAGNERTRVLTTVAELAQKDTAPTEFELRQFAAGMINLLGGVQLSEREKIAELELHNPTNGIASIVFQGDYTPANFSFNIATKDKAGYIVERLVVGTNFAETLVGDHPAVTNSYDTAKAQQFFKIGENRHEALNYDRTTRHPITLFESQKPNPDFNFVDHGRKVMRAIYNEYLETQTN